MRSFDVVGRISQIETIARGSGVRIARALNRRYGSVRWRKCKGAALVRLADGSLRRAEIHWYEAHGIGRREMKIKRLLDQR